MESLSEERRTAFVINRLIRIITLCKECMDEIQSSGISYRVMDILAEGIPEASEGLFNQVFEDQALQSHLNNTQQTESSKMSRTHATIRKIAIPANIGRIGSKRQPSNNMIRHILLSKYGALSKKISESKP